MRNPTRDAQIVERYKAGETQEQLASAFHLSRGRINQVLTSAGVTRKDNPARKNNGDLYAFVGVNVTKPMKARLAAVAKRKGKSMSGLLNEALTKQLSAEED